MPVYVEKCPLCGSQDSAAFDRRKFRDQVVSNRICTRCGLVYQSPRMSDQELDDFYAEEYRTLYQGSAGPSPKDLAVQEKRAEVLLSFVKPKIRTVSRHLDIGCSAGLLLQAFQAAYACQSIGVEPGDAYRQYAQTNGLPVYATIDECRSAVLQAGEQPFDLISLAHVLEHLPDPISYLSSLRQQLLSKSGWLLIEVPNLYGHDCFEVAHLVSYSPHTLSQTLRQAGFEICLQETHGRPRSQGIPLYITVLCTAAARPDVGSSSQQPVPEMGVQQNRRWAMLRRKLVARFFPKRTWLPLASSPGQQPADRDTSTRSK